MRAGYWQDLLSEEEVVAGMNTFVTLKYSSRVITGSGCCHILEALHCSPICNVMVLFLPQRIRSCVWELR